MNMSEYVRLVQYVMDWLSNKKEEVVIQLYKENKSFQQIATLTHMSFRDISAITKKVELQAAREEGMPPKIPNPSRKNPRRSKCFRKADPLWR